MRARMRPRVLLQEIVADMADGTARTLTWMLLLAGVVLPVALFDVLSVDGQVRHAYALRDAGAAVYVLSAPGGVDASLCEALGQSQGTSGPALAGAMRKVQAATIDALPGTTLPLYEATPGLSALLASTGRVSGQGGGLLLGQEASTTLLTEQQRAGLDSGSPAQAAQGRQDALTVALNGTRALVHGTYPWPQDGRPAGLSYAAVAPVPAEGLFDECWVSSWPARTDLAVTLRSAVSPDAPLDLSVEVSQLNYRLGQPDALTTAYTGRMTRFNVLIVAVAAAVVGWLSVRLRRLELASDLNVGVARRDLTLKLLAHTIAWALPAATGVLLAGTVLSRSLEPGDAQALQLLAACYAGAATAGAVLGCVVAALLVRERALAHYSRDRA